MKKFLHLVCIALTITLFHSTAQAQDAPLPPPYEFDFSSVEISSPSNSVQTVTPNEMTWKISGATYNGTIHASYSEDLGAYVFGSSETGYIQNLVFETEGFKDYYITKITIEFWATKTQPFLNISAGQFSQGNTMGDISSSENSAPSSITQLIFEPKQKIPNLRINWMFFNGNNAGQLCIKTIKVEVGNEPVIEDIEVKKPMITTSTGYNTISLADKVIIVPQHSGSTTSYTTDGTDPKTSTTRQYTGGTIQISLPATGEYNIQAVSYVVQNSQKYYSNVVSMSVTVVEPPKYLSDIFDFDNRTVKADFVNKQTKLVGYLTVIGTDESSNTIYAQGPKGHTIRLHFTTLQEITTGEVLYGVTFTPSVDNGILVGTSGNFYNSIDRIYSDPDEIAAIELPDGESLEVTTVDLTNEADWSAFAVGKAVTYTGEFDAITGVEIPKTEINFSDFHQYITLNGGKVKFVPDHFGANAEALKAMNRHIWLTANPEDKVENDNGGFKLEGILVPAAPAASDAAAYAPGDVTAQFFATKATAPGGGTITGIEDITASGDENAPAEYFNLMGVKVSNPVSGTLYIVRQGSKVTKQIAD